MSAKSRKPKPGGKRSQATSKESPAGAAGPPSLPRNAAWWLVLAMCVIVAVLALTATWAVPRNIGDLYVGLAGGRDVLAGKLGQPDDWSFMTEGHIWINQNWGTHLLTYGFWQAGGEIGLLLFKALLILCAAGGVLWACRLRRVDWPVAVLIVGGVIMAGQGYIDLRPNLSTLAVAPVMLALLYWSRRGKHRIWWALALIAIWANVHGGFALGIGMIGLWSLCEIVPAMLADGLKPALRRHWPALTVTLGAILLPGLLSPFGFENLTHPLVVAGEAEWRTVDEWKPIYEEAHFGSVWEFKTYLGVLFILLLVRAMGYLMLGAKAARTSPPDDADSILLPQRIGRLAYDIVLSAVVLYAAIQSRRFIPIAMLLTAPIAAMQLNWLLAGGRRIVLTIAAAVALTIPAAWLAHGQMRHYAADNPLEPRETLMQRMHMQRRVYPHEAAQFLNENGIEGRTLNEWRWEGYLQWKSPQLELFTGGRAQQAYDIDTYRLRSALFSDRVRYLLKRLDVNLVVVPVNPMYNRLFDQLIAAAGSSWRIIFYNEISIVLADGSDSEALRWILACQQGELEYPSKALSKLSRGLCLSRGTPEQMGRAAKLLMAANSERPTTMGMLRLRQLAESGQASVSAAAESFNAALEKLLSMPYEQAGGRTTLALAHSAARHLAALYRQMGKPQEAREARIAAQAAAETIRKMEAEWR